MFVNRKRGNAMLQKFKLGKRQLLIAIFCGILFLTSIGVESVLAQRRPTEAQVAFAKETADLLQAELFAALLQEFSETTPENVQQGSLAISLVFDDCHKNFRLIGRDRPLRRNDLPQDSFERRSLQLALQGEPNEVVQTSRGRSFVRRSVPLSNFDPSCALCHTNFGPVDPEDYVGALTLRVPVPPLTNNRR